MQTSLEKYNEGKYDLIILYFNNTFYVFLSKRVILTNCHYNIEDIMANM